MAVDLALAKQQCRVDSDDEDALIAQYLAAAVAWVENYTGKKLTRGVVTQEAAEFSGYLPLYWGPQPASLTITYTDTDDVEQTITNATINGAKVYPAASWPRASENTPITLSYTAGYSTVPAELDSAVLLLVGAYYENREGGDSATEFAVEALCRPYRALHV